MIESSTYTITELAKQFNLSEHTLRKYESDFKLKIPRTEMGHRYYTDHELDVFTKIIEWKTKGLNKTTIQKLLSRSTEALDQEEHALELITLDKLTGKEMKDLLAQQIGDLLLEREEKLKEDFEEKLKLELEKQQEVITDKIMEQIKAENKKLTDYINDIREEDNKGFWSRVFGRKK